jgi:Protein of unknown function (DUF3015)
MKLKHAMMVCALTILPAAALAAGENNVGSCGWGTKLFDGQSGLGPQIFAATTNGTLGNQTFGMSTGSSGCTADGTVRSNWKTAMFIDGNKERLARDMSRGSGESLDSLAQLLGVSESHKGHFFRVAKANFERIYAADRVSAQDIMNGLRAVLAADQTLAAYTAAI